MKSSLFRALRLRALLGATVALLLCGGLTLASAAVPGGPWRVLDVQGSKTGAGAEALLYLFRDDERRQVAGRLDGKTVVYSFDELLALEIDDNQHSFCVRDGGELLTLRLRDASLYGQLLLKAPCVCHAAQSLRLTMTARDANECSEVEEKPEDQEGDWDACGIGYAAATQAACGAWASSTVRFYKMSYKLPVQPARQAAGREPAGALCGPAAAGMPGAAR